MIRALVTAAMLYCCAGFAAAQDFSALARVDAAKSTISVKPERTGLDLALSQGVPFRAYTLTAPPRLVLDFREVDFSQIRAADVLSGAELSALRFGVVRPGWSRLVLDLPAAQIIDQASLRVDDIAGTAELVVRLSASSADAFTARSGAPQDPAWAEIAAPQGQGQGQGRGLAPSGTGRLSVVLDPGHGGIDPGAVGDGITEADLMLVLAQEIRDALVRSGDFDVVLTREDDQFVSLERRVQIARAAGADMFVSLHADALASGKAHGAAVYTLSDEASDAASAALAERHNRTDLLAGVDLSGQDDEIASILMDLARLENAPRSRALARGIILGIKTEVGHIYKRPIQSAGFSVLKAADIPSVLIEVGFLSSKDDLSKLTDPVWRARLVKGIHNGIQAWLLSDAADAQLRRK